MTKFVAAAIDFGAASWATKNPSSSKINGATYVRLHCRIPPRRYRTANGGGRWDPAQLNSRFYPWPNLRLTLTLTPVLSPGYKIILTVALDHGHIQYVITATNNAWTARSVHCSYIVCLTSQIDKRRRSSFPNDILSFDTLIVARYNVLRDMQLFPWSLVNSYTPHARSNGVE